MENSDTINAARNGDKQALSGLLMEYRNMVSSVVARMVFEEDSRKDVIQNIFVKAVNAIQNFSGTCKFSTWLYRIALNETAEYNRNAMRAKARFTAFDNDDPIFIDLNSPDGLENYTKKEISLSINEAVNTLPIDQKTAFSLFYFCGYTGKDAASVLNIKEDNFFMKLKTARDKVKKFLSTKGYGI